MNYQNQVTFFQPAQNIGKSPRLPFKPFINKKKTTSLIKISHFIVNPCGNHSRHCGSKIHNLRNNQVKKFSATPDGATAAL